MALMVKTLPANAGDIRERGSIPGLGRSPGGGHYNPLQYSCLENPIDRGAWQATVHKVTKSWARLCDLACMHTSSRDLLHNIVPLTNNNVRISDLLSGWISC